VVGADERAQLPAAPPALSQGMFAQPQFIPDLQVFTIAHFDQAQASEVFEQRGQVLGSGHDLVEARRIPRLTAKSWRGQTPPTLLFTIAQRLGGDRQLPVAFAIQEIQTVTDDPGQTPAVDRRASSSPIPPSLFRRVVA
jgi:hypothetical protein